MAPKNGLEKADEHRQIFYRTSLLEFTEANALSI